MRRACFVIRYHGGKGGAGQGRHTRNIASTPSRQPSKGGRDSEVSAHALDFGRQTGVVRSVRARTRTSVAGSLRNNLAANLVR